VYVALAAENALVALPTADYRPIGRVPTGWYPQAGAVADDGNVIVANAKGQGLGPADGSISKSEAMPGTLSLLPPAPTDSALAAGTATVKANNQRPSTLAVTPVCAPGAPARFPLPLHAGDPSPIEHVVLI